MITTPINLVSAYGKLKVKKLKLSVNILEPDNKKLASSTQIEHKTAKVAVNVKLQLAASLRKMSLAQSKHTQAIKRIPWDTIKIDGYGPKELEEQLKQIMKSVGVHRTLDEILADYESNPVKFDCASHPDLPTKPTPAHFQYVKDNREKFTQILQKRDPSAKIPYVSFTVTSQVS